jgi:hypothetical protein
MMPERRCSSWHPNRTGLWVILAQDSAALWKANDINDYYVNWACMSLRDRRSTT